MKKFSILIVVGCILCIGLAGATGYYIGYKTQKPVQQSNTTGSKPKIATDTDALKAQLKEEVKEEVRQELYDEVYEEAYNAAYTTIESELDAKINELQEEAGKQTEEAAKEAEAQQQTTEAPKSSNNSGNGSGNHQQSTQAPKEEPVTQAPASKADPYINVHDVTASASGGTAAIEAALRSALDSSSGTVMSDTSAITGIGTFPVYWTSTDGATATSYITITE